MKVVITGGTGAIGMALTSYLIKEGMEVLLVVRKNSTRRSRLSDIASKGLRILSADLFEYNEITENTLADDGGKIGNGYSIFFHLAWAGTIGDGRNDMYLQNENIKYTLDAVHLAKRLSCTTFLGAGSQAEYGRTEKKITASLPTFPEMGYGMAKLCAGSMSREECKKLSMKHIWVRILSIYGPGDGEATMITSAIRKMLAEEETAFSKGEQLWDYLYSEDAARALFLAADKGTDGSVYPVGSGMVRPLEEYIRVLAEAVTEYTGKVVTPGIGKIPYREKQVMYLCADIGQLIKDTGFVPKVSFEEGIRETIKAYCLASNII